MPSEHLDPNKLEMAAQGFIESGAYRRAIDVYLYMSIGDPSLDGGYLGKRLGDCYAAIGDRWASRYWYERALEENPVVNADCLTQIEELGLLDISALVSAEGM